MEMGQTGFLFHLLSSFLSHSISKCTEFHLLDPLWLKTHTVTGWYRLFSPPSGFSGDILILAGFS